MTLYEEIGGQAVLKTAVTVFYDRVLADDLLAHWFEGIDLSRLRAHQRAFLAAALDGPGLFAGRDLREAHRGMQITEEAFSAIVVHLTTTLDDLGVPAELLSEVTRRLEAQRSSIVETPAG